MSTLAYSEDQLVEQPAIGLFAELGWATVSAMEEVLGPGGTLGREAKGEVVLVPERGRPHISPFPGSVGVDPAN
jgi:type I restriction enzyme, R subunit